MYSNQVINQLIKLIDKLIGFLFVVEREENECKVKNVKTKGNES